MMKGVGSPFRKSLLITMPDKPRTTILTETTIHATREACLPNMAPDTKVRTPNLAVQGTKGVRKIVSSRALRDSIILAPMIEGTLHPNPRHMGKKLFP